MLFRNVTTGGFGLLTPEVVVVVVVVVPPEASVASSCFGLDSVFKYIRN